MQLTIQNDIDMRAWGERLGRLFDGSYVVELVGDVGAGKTTLAKGIARGLDIDEDIQSPTFTISRLYAARDGLTLAHYDFYRLSQPGIMAMELAETVGSPKTIVVLEWAQIVDGVLPSDRVTIEIESTAEDTRTLNVRAGGERSRQLLAELEKIA